MRLGFDPEPTPILIPLWGRPPAPLPPGRAEE